MIMIQEGARVFGFTKEPNTFGKRNEPWLHAVFKGTIDDSTGDVNLTKTYDGTGGESHAVIYDGKLSRDAKQVVGDWSIDAFRGRFRLDRVANTNAGEFSGLWSGTFMYPASTGRNRQFPHDSGAQRPVHHRLHQGNQHVRQTQ